MFCWCIFEILCAPALVIIVTLRICKSVKQRFWLLVLRQTDVLKGSRDILTWAPRISRGFWRFGDCLPGPGAAAWFLLKCWLVPGGALKNRKYKKKGIRPVCSFHVRLLVLIQLLSRKINVAEKHISLLALVFCSWWYHLHAFLNSIVFTLSMTS